MLQHQLVGADTTSMNLGVCILCATPPLQHRVCRAPEIHICAIVFRPPPQQDGAWL